MIDTKKNLEPALEPEAEEDEDQTLPEAEEAIERLMNLRPEESWATRDITLLRLRALLARARGDDNAYRDLVIRYSAMAKSVGFQGHIDWATAMADG